jgi:hypothetical protein
MQLSVDMFQEVLAGLKGDRGADQRREPRVGLHDRVTIVAPGKSGSKPVSTGVWVRDLSPGGIGIVHNSPLDRGTDFVVHLDGPDGESMRATYMVQHCTPLGRRQCRIGALLKRIEKFAPLAKTG